MGNKVEQPCETLVPIELTCVQIRSPNQLFLYEAMAKAEVGDDVLGDDPTVQQLESMVAKLCGKDAGLFVPSGTMSNAVALKTHTVPGDEIVTGVTATSTSMREAGMLHFVAQASLFLKDKMDS